MPIKKKLTIYIFVKNINKNLKICLICKFDTFSLLAGTDRTGQDLESVLPVLLTSPFPWKHVPLTPCQPLQSTWCSLTDSFFYLFTLFYLDCIVFRILLNHKIIFSQLRMLNTLTNFVLCKLFYIF